MKEYSYEVEHRWERQQQQRRPPPPVPNNPSPPSIAAIHQAHSRQVNGDDAAMDADASSMSETTSESGVSDLETSMTDFRCQCCPYGYHLDTDFMKFLDDMYGPDVLRTLKKIERKRHDVRRRLINEQPGIHIPVQSSIHNQSNTNSSSFDNEIIRETLLELDRIVEKDIKELEAECHRHAGQRSHSARSSSTPHQRSRSVDSRRHLRPPPRPPKSASSTGTTSNMHSSSSHTAEEQRHYEHRMMMEKTITTRTHSAPRLNQIFTGEDLTALRRIDTNSGGPITMLYKIPPPPFSRSSSSSSISTETTLRVSSPEPEDRSNEPLRPLYISEITVPPKPILRGPEKTKTTVVTITDKTEIERRNREIERLENERRVLLTEKELLLKEIERYKNRPIPKVPEQKTYREHIEQTHIHHTANFKPSTREVAMQHVVEEDHQIPPPLPPKQRQQRDVAISHTTEYEDDDEKQAEIVRRKLEEIKNFYSERIHLLEDRIREQEHDIERLTEPKKQRHVNTQCQPSMQDRALVTDTFRSVRDVALTCHLQPTLPGPIARRDVNLQCNTHEFIQQRDVWMEAMPDLPIMRDVSIGVALGTTTDKHFRDVATHVNFDFKPEIRQRDVATMFAPEPILKHDRASNTQAVQTREFAAFANTIEPPKPPPKPAMRPVATDTRNLIVQKDIACGSNERNYNIDRSTDTSSLVSSHDQASGHDYPAELLARHVSTDTRTLISTRDNFSATQSVPQIVLFDAQTQFVPPPRHDVASNTLAPAERRHTSVQAVEERPLIKNSTTSTDINVFHQLGSMRHSLSNTEMKRSTDRSTVTERQSARDSAMNTEPKIMYSKDVGDFDVRVKDDENESRFFHEEEITWNTLHGRRTGSTQQTVETHVRLPPPPPPPQLETTTEETYETTVTTTANRPAVRRSYEDDRTTIKSEMTEWTRTYGSEGFRTATEQRRSKSPEDLVEESYEVVSTLTKPHDNEFLTISTQPKSILKKSISPGTFDVTTTSKQVSSEDDSSYCEEWTVTEAKRKQDGQTVKTIIDRGGHHRYTIDAESVKTATKDAQVGETINVSTGTQIHEHEETVQISPSTVRKTTVYEYHRTLGSGSPSFQSATTLTDVRAKSPMKSEMNVAETSNEDAHIEEKYEVMLSTVPISTSASTSDDGVFEFDEEMYIACAIVNESLYDNNADKKKVNNCLQLIQQEWFRASSQKEVNGRIVQGYLNSIKEHFSNFLLERVVNLQDANGNTALHYCVTNGHWHVVSMLLDTKVCDVCLQNNAGYTAVMMAAVIDIATDEQKQVVRRLFRESGNVNVKTPHSHQTALMLAVKHGKTDLVELLLENGAAVNLQDADGSTALMCAVEHESLPLVKLILAKPECDVNIADNDGQTAVSIATNKNRKDILVVLYAKLKERKGHHSALGSKPRTSTGSSSSRLPTADRSNLNRRTTTTTSETASASSSTTRRGSGSDSTGANPSSGPTVSTFRRY